MGCFAWQRLNLQENELFPRFFPHLWASWNSQEEQGEFIMTLMPPVQLPRLAGLSHQESNPEVTETVPGLGRAWCFS